MLFLISLFPIFKYLTCKFCRRLLYICIHIRYAVDDVYVCMWSMFLVVFLNIFLVVSGSFSLHIHFISFSLLPFPSVVFFFHTSGNKNKTAIFICAYIFNAHSSRQPHYLCVEIQHVFFSSICLFCRQIYNKKLLFFLFCSSDIDIAACCLLIKFLFLSEILSGNVIN